MTQANNHIWVSWFHITRRLWTLESMAFVRATDFMD